MGTKHYDVSWKSIGLFMSVHKFQRIAHSWNWHRKTREAIGAWIYWSTTCFSEIWLQLSEKEQQQTGEVCSSQHMSCLALRRGLESNMGIKLHTYTKECYPDYTLACYVCLHMMHLDGKRSWWSINRVFLPHFWAYLCLQRVGYLTNFILISLFFFGYCWIP